MVGFTVPEREMSCFGKCCKGLMITFNVFFMCGGVACIGVGVWAAVDDTSQRIVILTNNELYLNAAIVIVSAGTAAIFTSILGCFAARYENRCLIGIYFILVMLIFITQFASGALALAYYTQVETFAHMEMRDGIMLKYGQSNHLALTDSFNYFQYEFDCCSYLGSGHDGAMLYQASLWAQQTLLRLVPPSCCKRDDDGNTIDQEGCQNVQDNDLSLINNIGCFDAVVEEASNYAVVIAGFGVGLSVMQFFGMLFAFCLCRST